jgi:tetratricopeptide (TPR) repeat protein
MHKQLDPKLSPLEAHDLKNLRAEAIPLLLGGQPAEVFARGDRLARAESWDKAAAEFARGLAVYPDEHWNWYRSGPLWVQLGDLEAYRRHCRSVLDLFASTTNGYVAERTAKLCFLVPDLLPDDPRPATLADTAVSAAPDFCWFLLAKAMAEYRAGEFQDALTGFERAKQAQSNNAYSLAIINLFLAMSHHRLGHADAARDRLAEGVQIIDKQLPKTGSGDVGEGWHDWLMCQLVRREAETLVRADGQR